MDTKNVSQVCVKYGTGIVVIIGIAVSVLFLTWYATRAHYEKECDKKTMHLGVECKRQLHQTQKQNRKQVGVIVNALQRQQQAPTEDLDAGPGIPPGAVPVNQPTHGYTTPWRLVGYVFPKDSDSNKRYPLYSRKNLTERHLYDYMVVDNSRNRVRINIDLKRGEWQLYDGDEIKIDSEPGKWIVRIDTPADYQYVPYLGPPGF